MKKEGSPQRMPQIEFRSKSSNNQKQHVSVRSEITKESTKSQIQQK
jgi:hypothetical protein